MFLCVFIYRSLDRKKASNIAPPEALKNNIFQEMVVNSGKFQEFIGGGGGNTNLHVQNQ